MRKMSRKLALSKETIRNLDDVRLRQAAAAPRPTTATCYPSCTCNTTLNGCVVEEL